MSCLSGPPAATPRDPVPVMGLRTPPPLHPAPLPVATARPIAAVWPGGTVGEGGGQGEAGGGWSSGLGGGAVCAQPAPRAVGLFGQPPAVRGMPTLQAARQGGLPASTIPHPPSSYGPPPHGAAQVVSWDRGTAGGLPPPRGHRHRRWGRVTPAEGAGNSPRAAVINRAPPPPPQASGVGEWTALPCP